MRYGHGAASWENGGMEPLEIRQARSRGYVAAAVTLGFGALAAFIFATSEGDLRMAGLVGMVFFLGGGGISAVRLLRGPAPLTLTAEGIRPGEGGLVTWDNLAEVAETQAPGMWSMQPAVGFKLRSRERYQATLTEGIGALVPRQSTDTWDMLFAASELSGVPSQVVTQIEAYRAAVSGGG